MHICILSIVNEGILTRRQLQALLVLILWRVNRVRFESKCEHQLKDILFYLKTEQHERGGKIAPFLGDKRI